MDMLKVRLKSHNGWPVRIVLWELNRYWVYSLIPNSALPPWEKDHNLVISQHTFEFHRLEFKALFAFQFFYLALYAHSSQHIISLIE